MEQVMSNQMLLTLILDKLTSQELLYHRLVCKLWRDETNRLICLRQQKFFFSPESKTTSPENRTDLNWVKSWETVLQISFIYSPIRDTFIRATRRLLDYAHPVLHLEASSLDPKEQQSESALFAEIENFYTQQESRTSQQLLNFNCKTAGVTLDEFTDYLQNLIQIQNQGESFDETSIFSCMSFRFECGRLRDRREICRFFGALGPKIQYLTVGFNHMCRAPKAKAKEKTSGPWYMDNRWDHKYTVFKGVPNLQVLTILPDSKWFNKLNAGRENIFEGGWTGEPKKDGDSNAPFRHLKCLRIEGYEETLKEVIFLHITETVQQVQRVVCEQGLHLRPFRSVDTTEPDAEPGLESDPGPTSSGIPAALRLITPISTLTLHIFKDLPPLLQNMAQIIELQQLDRGPRVKALYLYVTSNPDRKRSPYNARDVPPLLRILKAVAESLETLRLVGAAAVFLEGLLQLQVELQQNVDQQEPRLHMHMHSFPNVRKLFLCLVGSTDLRQDFNRGFLNLGLNADPSRDLSSDLTSTSTSSTTMSKVFPRVEQLNLDFFFADSKIEEHCNLWMAFLPRPDLMVDNQPGSHNEGQGQGRGQDGVDEVKTVKKILFGRNFSGRSFDFWKFSNLETLCLDYESFSKISSKIWSLRYLQTLMINQISSGNMNFDDPFYVPPMMEIIFGDRLLREVLQPYAADVSRSLRAIPRGDHEQCLRNKREALILRVNEPSILDLGRLRHLKLLYEMEGSTGTNIKDAIELLLLGLIPPSCHIAIWAMRDGTQNTQPMPLKILQKAAGPKISANPRVSLRTVRYDDKMPRMLF